MSGCRPLNAAELKVSGILQNLSITCSIPVSQVVFKEWGEDFLEKCYREDKLPDFDLIAVHFCEQEDPTTGKLLGEKLWSRGYRRKPRLDWPNNKERYVVLTQAF